MKKPFMLEIRYLLMLNAELSVLQAVRRERGVLQLFASGDAGSQQTGIHHTWNLPSALQASFKAEMRTPRHCPPEINRNLFPEFPASKRTIGFLFSRSK
jgi:hypothetical protein